MYKEIAFFSFILGGFVGAGIVAISNTYFGSTPNSVTQTLKHECELNIPRNQNCVMQFVPEKK